MADAAVIKGMKHTNIKTLHKYKLRSSIASKQLTSLAMIDEINSKPNDYGECSELDYNADGEDDGKRSERRRN